MKELIIGKNDAGKRLDRFVGGAVPLLPDSLLQKYIRLKRIKLNGRGAKRDVRLAAGDRVQLLGSAGSKLVSDVLTDKKVPRALRDRVPLIERDGEIIWIAGIAPCAPCAIGPGSRQALIIKYTRPKE